MAASTNWACTPSHTVGSTGSSCPVKRSCRRPVNSSFPSIRIVLYDLLRKEFPQVARAFMNWLFEVFSDTPNISAISLCGSPLWRTG